MTDADYFSDRVRGPRPRVNETIPAPVAKAPLALIDLGIRRHLLRRISLATVRTAVESLAVTARGS